MKTFLKIIAAIATFAAFATPGMAAPAERVAGVTVNVCQKALLISTTKYFRSESDAVNQAVAKAAAAGGCFERLGVEGNAGYTLHGVVLTHDGKAENSYVVSVNGGKPLGHAERVFSPENTAAMKALSLRNATAKDAGTMDREKFIAFVKAHPEIVTVPGVITDVVHANKNVSYVAKAVTDSSNDHLVSVTYPAGDKTFVAGQRVQVAQVPVFNSKYSVYVRGYISAQ